jgi:hypothetical protein
MTVMGTRIVGAVVVVCWIGSFALAQGAAMSDAGWKGEPKLSKPFGVDFDEAGAMYVIEYDHRLIKYAGGQATIMAGNGKSGFWGDGGPSEKSMLSRPHNVAVGPGGDIYISDTNNFRVRKIDAKTRVISTFAGTATKGFLGDGGPAAEAHFGEIYCAVFDPTLSKMYLADLENRRIRVIDMKSGIVSTIAGNGRRGVPKDGGTAVQEPLVDPRAVAADAKGNVYVLERSGHALRVVDSAGKIRTVAGTGQKGYSGDGGPALQAAMNGPKHLWVEKSGDVLIADTENHVIRRYRVGDGKIELVAGTGKMGSGADALNKPHGVYEHKDGTTYISDSDNHRIVKISPKK